MESIKIDKGLKSYMIDDDPNRVITFNPSDVGLMERAEQSIKIVMQKHDEMVSKINEIEKSSDAEDFSETHAEILRELDKFTREQTDHIFGAPVSDALFGTTSAVSFHNGGLLFTSILEQMLPTFEKEIKKEVNKFNKKTSKYTGKYGAK